MHSRNTVPVFNNEVAVPKSKMNEDLDLDFKMIELYVDMARIHQLKLPDSSTLLKKKNTSGTAVLIYVRFLILFSHSL